MDDVVYNKVATIVRCQQRVAEDYGGDPARLRTDQTRQDALLLNLQRACEAAIDLAMHIVRLEHLGIPQESRAAFTLLERAGLLDAALAEGLRRMVGFRNLAVHAYQDLDLAIVEAIIERHLAESIGAFAALALARWGD